MSIEELKDELKTVNIFPEDIKIIEPKKSRYHEHVNYIIFLKRGSIAFKSLKDVKVICHTVVRWDHYRRRQRGPTQCTVCLRPGHGSRNCNMAPRCLYCSEGHLSSNCPKYLDIVNSTNPTDDPVEVVFPAKCVLCDGDHFATDRSCPAKKDYVESRKKMALKNRKDVKKPANLGLKDFGYNLDGVQVRDYNLNPFVVPAGPTLYSQQVKRVSGAAGNYLLKPSHTISHIDQPFSFDELMSLTSDIFNSLRDIRTSSREDVIRTIMEISFKYLFNDDTR